MNRSPHIDPADCRTCGECCKHFDIWYPDDAHPIQLSEMVRFRMLEGLGDKVIIRFVEEGGTWLRFNIPCKHLIEDSEGHYTCAIYNDSDRPLICRHYPYPETTDCPHMQDPESPYPPLSHRHTLIGNLGISDIDLLRDAWQHWGAEMQITICEEELAELAEAIALTRAEGVVWSRAVLEEVADVLVCLQQMEVHLRSTVVPTDSGPISGWESLEYWAASEHKLGDPSDLLNICAIKLVKAIIKSRRYNGGTVSPRDLEREMGAMVAAMWRAEVHLKHLPQIQGGGTWWDLVEEVRTAKMDRLRRRIEEARQEAP